MIRFRKPREGESKLTEKHCIDLVSMGNKLQTDVLVAAMCVRVVVPKRPSDA